MVIKLSKTNQEFISTYEDWLVENEIEMQLFYMNILDANEELTKKTIRGGVYNDDLLVLIFLNPLKHPLQIISLCDDCYDAFDFLAQYLLENKIAIRGCQGNLYDCQQFVMAYQDWTGKLMKISWAMDILSLSSLTQFTPIGKLIKPTTEHSLLIEKGLFYFYLEALNLEIEYAELKKKVESYLGDPSFYLYANQHDEVTSFCKITTNILPHGSRIGVVFTFKEFRNNGYAKSMLQMVINEALKEKDYVTLFVDQKNLISNKVYYRLGFEKIIDSFEFVL